MHVRLIRKLAAVLNGLDLSRVRVGDVIAVSDAAGAMLIAETWAVEIPEKALEKSSKRGDA
jgi:hypothetical protein